ncbi:hypothetical protein SDC9_133101 [bioreactor metagenome]|uniref:Uncharacterized protein n=1 Tax=bioreactor metagenome TaxID=1076179 RepID=A0A645DAC1_9ZZZZ
MSYHFYRTIYRIPIGMNIEDAHEDRNHDTIIFEIFAFVHLFYGNNLAIGRGNDYFLCFLTEKTYGATEEVDH